VSNKYCGNFPSSLNFLFLNHEEITTSTTSTPTVYYAKTFFSKSNKIVLLQNALGYSRRFIPRSEDPLFAHLFIKFCS
jgi:hypothetical protein